MALARDAMAQEFVSSVETRFPILGKGPYLSFSVLKPTGRGVPLSISEKKFCPPKPVGSTPLFYPSNEIITNDPGYRNAYQSFHGHGTAAIQRSKTRIVSDFKNFYSPENLANYGVALVGCGVLANTKMDRRFQDWYADHVRCDFTDDFSEFSRVFGEGKYFIPIATVSAACYRLWQEKQGRQNEHRVAGDFFARTARGYAAGTPTLLFLQVALGGNRPRGDSFDRDPTMRGSSYWKPFQENHAISGHAYIGAVPFITAAEMSEPLWMKGLFYTLSIIPAWSRVNDDAHFLSQSALGWYLAYLSVRSVSKTEGTKPFCKGLTFFPVVDGNAAGIGFLFQR